MPLSESARFAGQSARSVYLKQEQPVMALQMVKTSPSMIKSGFALFANTTFWDNSSLESLWLLLSTSKDLRKKLFVNKDFAGVVELLLKDRKISIKEAMDRFAFTIPNLSDFRSKMPEKYPPLVPKLRKFDLIDFADAFKMAMERKGGLQTIVKIKDRAQVAAEKSLEKLALEAAQLQTKSEEHCETMALRVKNGLSTIKDKDNNPTMFSCNLGSLRKVLEMIVLTEGFINWIGFVLEDPETKKDRTIIGNACKNLRRQMVKLVDLYNYHCALGNYERIVL